MFHQKDVFIRASDQQIYLINHNIKKYSPVISKLLMDVKSEIGPITLQLSAKQLMLLSQYFSARSFEIPIEFIIKKPINSSKLNELLLSEDYDILKNWPKEDINDLLNLSLYLEIEALSDILLTIISMDYYVEIGDNSVDKFKEKTGLNEEISESMAISLKKEFPCAFS